MTKIETGKIRAVKNWPQHVWFCVRCCAPGQNRRSPWNEWDRNDNLLHIRWHSIKWNFSNEIATNQNTHALILQRKHVKMQKYTILSGKPANKFIVPPGISERRMILIEAHRLTCRLSLLRAHWLVDKKLWKRFLLLTFDYSGNLLRNAVKPIREYILTHVFRYYIHTHTHTFACEILLSGFWMQADNFRYLPHLLFSNYSVTWQAKRGKMT